MLSKVYGAGLMGIDGYTVCCEADVSSGLPSISMIGYLASEVKEAAERVRTAVKNSGYELRAKKVVINLSPANIRKEGCGFDLPVAVALMCAYGITDTRLTDDSVFIGELSLGGELLPVRGIMSMASAAASAGFKRIFLPAENAAEGAVLGNIDIYPVKTLKEMADILNSEAGLPEKAVYIEREAECNTGVLDFSDINGQEGLKRAAMIAAAGRHNILIIGPAGTGKSMLAQRLPGIMPGLSREERLEISRIYSVMGMLPENEPLICARPFRAPHHTISGYALSGGGRIPKPGEVTLAHKGVLFLDELAEFRQDTIEVLRQPMENKTVSISRVQGSYTFPADFMLCAATNPCKCGFYPDRSRCSCTDSQVRDYLGRISRPILDRIDICVETRLPAFEELNRKGDGESSGRIREKIERVRMIQEERFKNCGIHFNSEMNKELTDRFCILGKTESMLLKEVYESNSMSARSMHKILKLSRTVADFEGSESIEEKHLAEAIGYKLPESFQSGGFIHAKYR